MPGPSNGGWNQRERTKSESFCRASGSAIGPSRPLRPMPQMNGIRNHLLQALALRSAARSCVTSASSSHRLRSLVKVRLCASARASMTPLMPAGRRAGDDVDDHAEVELAADLAQQVEIDRLGVVLGVLEVEEIGGGRVGPDGPVADRVERGRGADELQDLLADAMHVDGERHAAEEHQRQAKFLLAHPVTRPASSETLSRPARVGRTCRHADEVASICAPEVKLGLPEGPRHDGGWANMPRRARWSGPRKPRESPPFRPDRLNAAGAARPAGG